VSLYSREDERAIRTQRRVEDWTQSRLLLPEQKEQILPMLRVDLRRTNRFLRITLFIFGFMVVNAGAGLVAVFLDFDESAFKYLALLAAAACLFGAQSLVTRHRLYHFGVEEAIAIAAVSFAAVFAATLASGRFSTVLAIAAATAGAWALFVRFGYPYAAIGAVVLAPGAVFTFDQTDTVRRLMAFTLLLTIFFLSRERRLDHDDEYPGDVFGRMEAVAWGGMYLIANLKISEWLSVPDGVALFYWGTYAVIWMLPAVGLTIAVRERQRALLDVNIVLAILTVMTNKPYLGVEQKPWDPILFGLTLIGLAVGLRRWMANGPGGSRHGFVGERLLASEAERVALAGSAAALVPGAPTHADPAPAIGGGGESGGAGAGARF